MEHIPMCEGHNRRPRRQELPTRTSEGAASSEESEKGLLRRPLVSVHRSNYRPLCLSPHLVLGKYGSMRRCVLSNREKSSGTFGLRHWHG